MTIASDITAEVLAQLTKYGRDVTLTVNNEGDYDPSTGTVSGDDTTDYTVKGLLLGYKDRDIDGTRIQANDRKCIISASGLSPVPATGDILTASSVSYSVISVKTYEVNGTTFAYVLQIRNA